MNKSAASAASLDYVKFQAVIKSAASAASRKTKNQGPRSRGAQATFGRSKLLEVDHILTTCQSITNLETFSPLSAYHVPLLHHAHILEYWNTMQHVEVAGPVHAV